MDKRDASQAVPAPAGVLEGGAAASMSLAGELFPTLCLLLVLAGLLLLRSQAVLCAALVLAGLAYASQAAAGTWSARQWLMVVLGAAAGVAALPLQIAAAAAAGGAPSPAS